jgi:hypothetical protein
MIDDVLATLPAAKTAMSRAAGEWTCLGVIERREDAELVRATLGDGFDFTTERIELPMTSVGGQPWLRTRTTWEVWARAVGADRISNGV